MSDYTNVLQQFMAQFFLKARAQSLATRVVNLSLDPAPAERGDTINITLPTNYTAKAVTPGATPVAGDAANPTKASLVVDQMWDVSTNITDKQWGEIQRGVFNAEQDAMVVAMVEKINASIYAETLKFYNVAGTAGTNPFATDEQPLLDAIQHLDEERAPSRDGLRVGILSPAAKNKALRIGALTRVDARGDGSPLITGILGNSYGVDVMMDQLVPSHVAGTITTGLIAKAATAQALGLKAIVATTAASTGAAALKAGDIIAIVGSTQHHVLTANATQASAASDVTLNIEPGLKVALVGSEAITVIASHQINPIMHRDAITFASRPIATLSGIGEMQTLTDPQTGISLTVELQRQHYQSKLAIAALWGVKSFRPEYGARLLG